MRARRRWSAAAIAVAMACGVAGLAPASARAEDASGAPSNSNNDAIARIVEAATVRMKALTEEARLLEAAGKNDEALAALRSVATVYEETMRIVRTLGPAPVVRVVPLPGATPGATGISSRPRRPTPTPMLPPRVEPSRPLAQPVASPVGPAVDFLLRCQIDDGRFVEANGRQPTDAAPGAAHDLRATALALIALADVVGSKPDPDRREVVAMRSAADAIARDIDAEGRFGAPAEDVPYVAWGLATAYSRLGADAWAVPLSRALARVLATQGIDGAWVADRAKKPAGDDEEEADDDVDPGQQLLTALAYTAFLHEALPTSVGKPAEAQIRSAIERASLTPARFGVPSHPRAAPVAGALLRRLDARGGVRGRLARHVATTPAADPSHAPKQATDGLFLLWGTLEAASVFGFEDDAEGRGWWEGVLVPAMNRQRLAAGRDGSALGSWDPAISDSGSWGRVSTTALALLAWKVPSTDWIEPTAR